MKSALPAALFLIAASAKGAPAGSTPGAVPLTMSEAESRVEAANPRLAAARLEALAAGKREAQSRARHFGQVDAVASYNNYESARLVRPISIELFKEPALGMAQLPWDENQMHYGLVFQLPLLAGGALHEGDRIAALSRSVAEKTTLFTRDELRYNVRAAYRNALLAGHALGAARQYATALSKDESDARLKVSVGALAPVDRSKLTYALRGAEAQVAELEAQRTTAFALLAAVMGEAPPQGGFELAEVPDEVPTAAGAEGSDASESALALRADLAAIREGTRIFESRKRMTLEAFGPRLSLEGNVLWNRAPSVSGSLETHELAVMLKLPLWNGLGRIHAVREAEASLSAARERERGKELEIATQVVDARGRLESARARLAAGQAQRELGRDVARVEKLKLEQGTGKVEDYLAARTQELSGETAYWRGLYSLQSAVDYLDFVTARNGDAR